jgi:hypothetical protein
MELLIAPTGGIRCVYGEDVNLSSWVDCRSSEVLTSNPQQTDSGRQTCHPSTARCWVRLCHGLMLWQPNIFGCWNTGWFLGCRDSAVIAVSGQRTGRNAADSRQFHVHRSAISGRDGRGCGHNGYRIHTLRPELCSFAGQ